MNWIATNIRFPEDLYMELRMEAAKTRKSIAELIRERVAKKRTPKKADVEKMMKDLDKFAKKMARENKGINFTKGLIAMRYEQ